MIPAFNWIYYKFKNLISKFGGGGSMQVEGNTFTYTAADGTKTELTLPTPRNGVSVTDIALDDQNQLVTYLSNGEKKKTGKIKFEGMMATDTIYRDSEAAGEACSIKIKIHVTYYAVPSLAFLSICLCVNGTIEAGEKIQIEEIGYQPDYNILDEDRVLKYYLQKGLSVEIDKDGIVRLINSGEALTCENLKLQIHRTFYSRHM